MAIFKCKMCGGTIEFTEGATVGVCDSCGTKQTLPRAGDDITANLFNRANNLRLKCEFDKAAAIYEKIVEGDDSNAEAHWGIVLCKYGIEYVEDPKTHKRIPTCHRTLYEAVTADADYLAAVDYGDAAQQALYESEARAIDRIQKNILTIVKNEKPFDVFICYKETDENGKRTVDSAIANDIYYQLTQEGFKVFFAAITLEDKLGQEYEPYIFAALHSARVMLALGTKPEYFSAVWVKNEWSRFLSLMKTDRSKLLIPCYRDMDPYDLPEEFAHLQAQDMGKIGFINDLTRGIRKVCGATASEKAPVRETVVVGAAANVAPLLKRAFLFLEDGEWERADEFCEQVLNQEPENGEAYLGKLMAELHVRRREELGNCENPFDGSNNYQKAVRFGGEKMSSVLNGFIIHINERNENERLTGIYNSAVSAMNAANTESAYKAAAETFKSIPGFKDADGLADQCLDNAKACRLDAERKKKEARIAAEKAAKKRKKIAAIVIPVVVVCVAFVFVLIKIIIPKQKFNKAMGLLASGDYEAAYALLEEIGDNDTIGSSKYDRAVALIDSGDYEAAYALLEEIGDNDTIGSSKYDRAVALIDSGDYEAAYMLLNGLNYKDSADKAAECLFLKQKSGFTNVAVGSTIKFGFYEQDNRTASGKKEEIEWKILAIEGNKVLVISLYALDCQRYNSTYTDTFWGKCTLRTWLNGSFYNNAFSSSHKKMIITSPVLADKNPVYNTSPGNNTTDKVFLLSIAEVNKYFGNDEARKCAPTDYAIAQGAGTSDSYKTGGRATCWWWLRSPGGYSDDAAGVNDAGSVFDYGYGVNRNDGAVRPAMWIDIFGQEEQEKGLEDANKYNAATELYNEGKYSEALPIFNTLTGYKDSTDYITKCKENLYNEASSLLNKGNAITAYQIFVTLSYKDSAERAKKIFEENQSLFQRVIR